jgi:hypothetical protein
MRRLHVHTHVDDVAASVTYYTRFFGQPPDVLKHDYAKWLLEDPRVNFAISNEAGHAPGIAHLGLQFDDRAEFEAFRQAPDRAALDRTNEDDTVCCYANSDKAWFTDPDKVDWETFFTFGAAETCRGVDDPERELRMPMTTHRVCCD